MSTEGEGAAEIVTAALENWMTDGEYVNVFGLNCPKCKSPRTAQAEGISQITPTTVRHSRKCNSCDARWVEIYRLVGYRR